MTMMSAALDTLSAVATSKPAFTAAFQAGLFGASATSTLQPLSFRLLACALPWLP